MSLYIVELVVFIISVFFAGLITAGEIALSSFGENKIDELKERGDNIWQKFQIVHKNPEPYYGTIHLLYLIFIISSVVFGFLLSAKLINPDITEPTVGFYDNSFRLIISFVLTIVTIASLLTIFSYLIPKALGFKYSNFLGRIFVVTLIPVSKLFIVPARLLNKISDIILLPFKERTNFAQTKPSEDEILDIIADGVKSGAIDEKEEEIIQNIIEFNDLKAGEVMVPRTEMISIDINESDETLLKGIILKGHTLIPVYEDSIDNIVGILHSKDVIKLLIESGSISSIKNLIRPAYFIPETKLISEILTEMQQRGERLAIVSDEYGGTEGVITIEDILEEIVGEIKNDSITEQKEYYKFPDNKYFVLGSMQITDFNEVFNLSLPESDEYNTIAGFIAEQSGKILSLNETVEYENVKFELIKKIRQKMVQFKIYSEVKEFKEK
ncbi:MAG: HlyC/CorC family transporter [Ignavibacteriota bacterium]|jgi:putative hemolysin|nr:MAG: HlyC/CorC family transporter [Chlorobiota bacterium]MBE7477049.1 HlyC/CorC family transporter [Ignavibacteriales bacterium]MBL1121701.1 HlyC/CorC family transporter [Ignavibacteriota bacterium]MCC7095514.1 HlyC/CorC family transporter [Ignavibacteriaceae bacterium]MCE7857875.1 HlyC/CorC family transporter [Ignavibacteria bacterium CHB3]MEB2297388.1 hemolysin family protein [Ignavibacteria bacterium]